MAALWQTLRSEWKATISDIQEKGAIAVFQDAALDAVDIVKDTGGLIAGTAASLLSNEGDRLILTVPAIPTVGSHYPLLLGDGVTRIEVEVLAVDTISKPVRATVRWMESGQELVVTVDVDGELQESMTDKEHWLVSELRQELQGTIEEFRSKGPVGVLKDATLDAVDIIHEGADTACSGARTVAEKAIDLLGAREEPEAFNPEMNEMYENAMLSSEASKPVERSSLGHQTEEFQINSPRGSPAKSTATGTSPESASTEASSPCPEGSESREEEEMVD